MFKGDDLVPEGDLSDDFWTRVRHLVQGTESEQREGLAILRQMLPKLPRLVVHNHLQRILLEFGHMATARSCWVRLTGLQVLCWLGDVVRASEGRS